MHSIEQAASSASRDARAHENAVENDEKDDDRSETVGASTEGAAASTTDQARQDAAPVSTYPTHVTHWLSAAELSILPIDNTVVRPGTRPLGLTVAQRTGSAYFETLVECWLPETITVGIKA